MAATISWTDEAGKFYFVNLDSYDEETHGLTAEVTKFPAESGGVISDNVRLGNRVLQLVGFVSNTPLPQNDAKGRYRSTDLTIPSVPAYKQQSQKLDIPSPPIKPNLAGVVSAGFNALFGSAPEALLRARAADRQIASTAQIWSLDDPRRSRVSEVWTLLEQGHTAKVRVDVATESIGLVPGLIMTEVSAPIKADDGDGAPFSISFEQIRTVTAETVTAPKPLEPMGQKRKPTGSKATKPETEEDRERRKKSLLAALGDKAIEAITGAADGHR
jgi:hypothetical protein